MSRPKTRAGRRRWPRLLLVFAMAAGVLGPAWWYASVRARRERERQARGAITDGQASLKRGRPDRALRAVASVPETGPWAAELLTVKGLAFAALDRPEAARPVLERSLSLDPNQPMTAKVLAAIYFSASELDRGFAMLERAARLDPSDFRPWFAAGEITLQFHNQPAEAIRAFKEALRRRPGHEESRLGLADALLSTGSASEASPLLEAAMRERPGDPRVWRLAARHARLSGQPEEMNRFAERALELDPDDTEAQVLHARYLHLKGRHREALTCVEQAVARSPNDLSALSLLAQVEGSLGLKDRAAATSARHRGARDRAERIGQLRDAIKARPDDPEPHWRMGQEAAEGGLRNLAVNSFRAALSLDPLCAPARKGLAALNVPWTDASLSFVTPSASGRPTPPGRSGPSR